MLRNSFILFTLLWSCNLVASGQAVITINERELINKKAAPSTTIYMTIRNAGSGYKIPIYSTIKSDALNKKLFATLTFNRKGMWSTHQGDRFNMLVTEGVENTDIRNLNEKVVLSWQGDQSISIVNDFGDLNWNAGEYKFDLKTRLTCSPASSNPLYTFNQKELIIKVSEILTDLSQKNKFDFKVDNLSYFRSGVNNLDGTFSFRNTVPFTFQVTGTKPFAFTNGFKNVSDPGTGMDGFMLALTPSSNTAVYDNINKRYDFDVEKGNQLKRDLDLSIPADRLKSGFINSGDYKAVLDATATSSSSTPIIRRKTYEVNVHVADLGELVVSQSQVDLKFTNVEAYQNGVEFDLPAHLRVSKTTPYNITVKADNANFISGEELIPVTILGISAGNKQDGVTEIPSITTQPQVLVSGQAVIDRDIAIKYKIDKDKTTQLLNKKPGNYTANIIYTLTAQ